MKRHSASALAGVCIAASMPPWGWWPLTFIGLAIYSRSAWVHKDTHPFRTAFIFGFFWFLPAMAWMWFLTIPGYLIAVVLFASMHGVAGVIAARIARDERSHRTALIVTHSLVETARLSFPFGGVPLATLAISQVSSPLGALAPFLGTIGLCVATMCIALMFTRPKLLAVLVVLGITSMFWNGTHDTGRSLDITYIQGGGEQGTHAIYTSERKVFERHLAATQKLMPNDSRDLVIWPEDVVSSTHKGLFVDSKEYVELSAQAKRLNVPFIVGITEDADTTHFANAAVVIEPNGTISGRYDKQKRVPFGEYIPARKLFSSIGIDTKLVPRDAQEGQSRAWLDVADTRAAVAVSWEVFFGGRVNEGVTDGATFIVNPTNGSSYTWTILQTQQLAASKLRAREQSRWLVQVSPTGFSAFVSPHGNLKEKTGITHQGVKEFSIALREGRTLYSYLGNAPYLWALLLALAYLIVRRPRAFQTTSS